MKGFPERKADVQRMRVIAAECRAAATRIRLAARTASCYTVIRNEAQRHEALVEGSDLLPAFEVFGDYEYVPGPRPDTSTLYVLLRIMAPSGTSTHATAIGLCKPTKMHRLEVLTRLSLRVVFNMRAELRQKDREFKRLSAMISSRSLAEGGLDEAAHNRRDRRSQELDLDPSAAIDTPEYVATREGGAAYASMFVSDALVAMAEHLDFQVRSPELVKPRGIGGLDTNAKDVLKMLWMMKAFGEASAKPLKEIAGRNMPSRNRRKTVSTLESAAQVGFKELKKMGLAVARQNVGSWLTVEGRDLAESTWGTRAKK